MQDGQHLGVVRSYDDLHAILRARAEELEVSRTTIDEVAGLTPGYSSKLLAPRPMKIMGELSFGIILSALGIKLIAVIDTEMLTRFEKGRARRTNRMVRSRQQFIVTPKYMATLGAKGGVIRMKKLTAKQRSSLARKANRIRWERHRRNGASPTCPKRAIA